jgi:hypothetical protein
MQFRFQVLETLGPNNNPGKYYGKCLMLAGDFLELIGLIELIAKVNS